MAKKTDSDNDTGIIRQFNELKKKHPDAMLLFRRNSFYELYKQDAVKAAAVLAIEIADRILPNYKRPVKVASFPQSALDVYLPRLIRSGIRVAICDALDSPLKKEAGQDKAEINDRTIQNNTDMGKKKKEQGAQETPDRTVENTVEKKEQGAQETPDRTVENTVDVKPAREKKSKAKAETKAETGTDNEVKTEKKDEQKTEAAQERKPREPQMVTANGEKVTHGHAYQSTTNPADWYFTAKIDGQQLKPQKMDAADLAAYQNKEMTVPQLMERYYPTKLMPKVSEEAFRMPMEIAGPDGSITVNKFNVYKEKDEQRPDFGKYKFYVQVGNTNMSAVASRQDLNAYFDRVATPNQLIEKNFGERLHLKSAYEKYQLPEGVDPKGVRVAKDRNDNKWKVSVDLGEKGQTSRHEISFDDGYSLFKTKTATREQIAAKYLNTEITGMLAANTAKVEKTASMKM